MKSIYAMKPAYRFLILLFISLISSVSCTEQMEELTENPSIVLSTEKVDFEAEGGVIYITATSSSEISLSLESSWCKAEYTGKKTNNIRITAERNTTEEVLTADLIVSAEDCEDVKVTVTQKAGTQTEEPDDEPEEPLSSTCELTSFSIYGSLNGLGSTLEFSFDEATSTYSAMYLKWIDKDSPEMLIPTFTTDGEVVLVDGEPVSSGQTAISFADDVNITVRAEDGTTREYTVSLNCPQINTELPVIRLQPESEILDKENYINTVVTLYSPFTESGWWGPENGTVEVRGRGNSTWGLPKKPYRLKFPEKVSPIGLDHTKAKSWVILAQDMDKSLIRNHTAFELSRLLFNEADGYHDPSAILFTPCSQFINVYMNDDYHGVYQMSDHMEQREGRIAVEELTDKDGDDPEKITGGYIIETDIHEGNHFSPRMNIKMSYKYPDDKEYDPAQYEYITDFIGQMENVLYSGSFKDPQNGWRRYLDEKTLIDFIILKEFYGDLDAYTSTYMYKRRGVDKLFFGPIWDADKGWNNDNRVPHPQYPPQTSLMIYAGFYMPSYVENDWFQRLWQDETFRRDVAARWNSVKDRMVAKVNEVLDTQPAAMSKAIEANFEVWPFYYQASSEANMPAPTYGEEIERIRRITSERAAVLNKLFNQ